MRLSPFPLNNGPENSDFRFTVKGRESEPAREEVLSYVGNVPWFLPLVPGAESSFRQFDSSGNPFWGKPSGYGLMQIEKPSSLSVLFNWRENADAGKRKVATTVEIGKKWWNSQKSQWEEWNQMQPADKQLPMQADVTCGTYGTDANGSPMRGCFEDPSVVQQPRCTFTARDPAPAGTHHFRDAIAIKAYNGATSHFISWFGVDGWRIRNTNEEGRDYVSQVCSQNAVDH